MEERYNRAFTDKLYLIESIPPEDDSDLERKYLIMGTKGNTYKVKINSSPTCTCMDYRLRKGRCKHIFFVLARIMKVENETKKKYTKGDLRKMIDNIPIITHNLIANIALRSRYKTKQKEKETEEIRVEQKSIIDDLCPICLCELNDGTEIDYCKNSCGKSIHSECFRMWCMKNNLTCVFCRSPWVFEEKKRSKSESKDKEEKRKRDRSRSLSPNRNPNRRKRRNRRNSSSGIEKKMKLNNL